MKQTNNAIKFLMAQYRAIFKNAYFKGLTSAVLLTAGLAVAGGAQAASVTATDWPTLSGEVTLDGTGAAAPEYDKIDIDTSAENTNTVTINITASGAASESTIGSSSNAAAVNVTGANTTVNFLQADDSKAAKLTVEGVSDKASTFDVKAINITKGELAVAGFGTVIADTITLKSASTTDRNSAKITLSGAAATDAVLQGKLVSEGSSGLLDITGNGTLKTYTDEAGVNVDITVAAQKGATLDLSGDDETKKLLRLNDGTFTITGHSTDGSGASFTVKHGTLAVDDAVFLTAGTTGDTDAGELVLNADTDATDAVLRVSSAQLKSFLTTDNGVGVTTGAGDKAGRVTLTKGTIELTDSNAFDVSTLSFAANGSPASGSIEVGTDADSSIIKGTTLSIATDGLKDVSVLTVQADTLKLTELAGQDEKNQLFKGKTIAANYD